MIMLGLCKTVFLLHILSFFVECYHPSLSVRKMNRQLIARKRQNTLDLCQMFNVENEKVSQLRHNRVKRDTSSSTVPPLRKGAPEEAPVDRVEKIVDKLYDEPEDGQKVAYRKNNQTSTPKNETSKSGRRFDFAPHILDVDINEPTRLRSQGLKTIPVPWHRFWKHGIIPFFIDVNTYDTFLSEKITKAFDTFEQYTCIRLQRLRERPTDKDSLEHVQWLYITNPSGTRQCVHSNARKPISADSGVQMVVFGYDCMSEGEILHEVMHILGFSHEHERDDRDQYVTIMWDNIKPGYKKFFESKPRVPLLASLPYDYASVLHYPPRAFSKNGKFTLVAQSDISFGQREGLSEIDVEKVSIVFGGECIERNKQYLLKTCPTVIASKSPKEEKIATQQEIDDYFSDRIWPYGIVNYRLKDKIEFSIEERQNIEEVIKHIEKETCIEFRDFTSEDDDDSDTTTLPDNVIQADDGNQIEMSDTAPSGEVKLLQDEKRTYLNHEKITKNEANMTWANMTAKVDNKADWDWANMTGKVDNKDDWGGWGNVTRRNSKPSLHSAGRRIRRSIPSSPARRHANELLVLSRSPEPGCRCPEPGRASAQKELVITADCFNSVNDLLHLFVHVLGLDHQHNSHDRDEFLAINWSNLTSGLRDELVTKLPPAASVGFTYDYQSVMHYPWLDIKEGVTSIMYPIWNDGWAMGHWQGLSSTDVQKLNLLYFGQCQSRKKHMAQVIKNKRN